MTATERELIAKKIWRSIFAELYDRREFDWWWDDIDLDTKREIGRAMVEAIKRKLPDFS